MWLAANNIPVVPEITLMSDMGVGTGLQHVGVSQCHSLTDFVSTLGRFSVMFKYRWPLKNIKGDFHKRKISKSKILFSALVILESSNKINVIQRVFGEPGISAGVVAQGWRACLPNLGSILSTPASFAFSKEQGR